MWDSKAYNLANVETYSYQDVAETITEITGTPISYHSPTVEEYTQILLGAGVPMEYVIFLTGFALAQANGEFDFSGSDLESLLGRTPITLKDYLQTVYGKN